MAENPMSKYGDELETFIAPYRDAAAKLSSPFATLPANSRFGANHPLLAHSIDDAIIAMANTPQGNTIGENISNVARGLMAPQQFHRQQALQASMLPYEMAGPRINMLDKMAEMGSRDAAIKRADAYEQNVQSMIEDRDRRSSHLEEMQAKAQNMVYDEQGHPYERRDNGLFSLVTGQKVTDPNKTFSRNNPKDSTTGTFTEREISKVNQERMGKGLPPLDSAGEIEVSNQISGGRAGAAAGAADLAHLPKSQDDQFLNVQRQGVYDNVPLRMNEDQFANLKMFSPNSPAAQKYDTYTRYYNSEYVAKRTEAQTAFSNYLKYRQQGDRTGFNEWRDANPGSGSAKFVPQTQK